METRANNLLVGSFVLLILVGTTVFFLWLAKFQFDVQFTRYDIHFPGSVSGLKVGSSVELNGILVGEVVGIRIDPDQVENVIVAIEVPAETPVREDTQASLQIAGLTGGVTILLAGGTQDAPPLAPKPGEKRAAIASQASTLERFLEDAPELLQSLQLLVSRASALLSDDNQAAFAESLRNVSALTGALAARTDDIETLFTSAAQTMANLRDASDALKKTAGTINATVARNEPEVASLIGDLRKSATTMTRVSNEIEALIAENRAPLRDFTSEGLYELTNFLSEARTLIDVLNRVTTQVERDPARFIFGNQQKGYETRQ
ncbi:MAG: MlaD family protein [Alphaproteobacteria bacterium]|nr:MlaD family protein [Alphaproteobacteria bacterium]MCZ6592763.1 MlaD family protein [Alphaproteobacteria bacterium]MCZ6840331.1 MlaD family protein [Alphaproteobacteria bacterium]